MKKQSDAVRDICQQYCQEKEYEFGNGVDLKETFTNEDLYNVTTIIANGFDAGEIDMSAKARAKYDTIDKLKVYSRGLLNDRLRKHKELNGGDPYKAKKPGSMKGKRDPELKALQALLAQQPDHAEEIEKHIARRQAELDAEKAKKVEIDISALPADLVATLGLEEE